MGNFRLDIQYDGSRYNGWQRLGNTPNTIQGKLEDVLSQLTGHAVEVNGAGRTDAGVHARGQVASVRLDTALSPGELLRQVNHYLPEDIAVTALSPAPDRFHARLNAAGKRYVYRLWRGEHPDVFQRKYVCPWEGTLDMEAMREAAALLLGKHDFRSFCSNKRYKKSTVRTVTRLELEDLGPELRMTFEGDGFLYHMVRILAGTLAEVGMGERSADSMPALLSALDREQAGRTLPARGLILDEVFYH